jgi:hypothetical protein
MGAHTCNPSYLGGGDRKIDVRGQLGKNLVRTYLKKQGTARHWGLMPVILATHEAEIKRIAVQSQPG